jgi:hypothetical protein
MAPVRETPGPFFTLSIRNFLKRRLRAIEQPINDKALSHCFCGRWCCLLALAGRHWRVKRP